MGWEKRAYKRVMKVITEPLGSRGQMDMEQLEPWFRKKSDVLNHLTRGRLWNSYNYPVEECFSMK